MTLEKELKDIKRDVEKLKSSKEISEFLDECLTPEVEQFSVSDTVSVTELDDASQLIGSCMIGFFEAT